MWEGKVGYDGKVRSDGRIWEVGAGDGDGL